MDQPLPSKYTLWLFDVKDTKETNSENFYEKVRPALTVATLNEFVTMYSKLKKPKDMKNGCEIYFFKEGIKPLWEDPANENGGCFFLHIKKTFANRIWENILLSTVSQKPEVLQVINGIIVRVLTLEVVFFIWTRQLTKEQEIFMIQWVKDTAGLSNKIKLEFKPHPRKEPEASHKDDNVPKSMEQLPASDHDENKDEEKF